MFFYKGKLGQKLNTVFNLFVNPVSLNDKEALVETVQIVYWITKVVLPVSETAQLPVILHKKTEGEEGRGKKMDTSLWKKVAAQHKKEHILVSSNEVDEPRAYYTEWSLSQKEKNKCYILQYHKCFHRLKIAFASRNPCWTGTLSH